MSIFKLVERDVKKDSACSEGADVGEVGIASI